MSSARSACSVAMRSSCSSSCWISPICRSRSQSSHCCSARSSRIRSIASILQSSAPSAASYAASMCSACSSTPSHSSYTSALASFARSACACSASRISSGVIGVGSASASRVSSTPRVRAALAGVRLNASASRVAITSAYSATGATSSTISSTISSATCSAAAISASSCAISARSLRISRVEMSAQVVRSFTSWYASASHTLAVARRLMPIQNSIFSAARLLRVIRFCVVVVSIVVPSRCPGVSLSPRHQKNTRVVHHCQALFGGFLGEFPRVFKTRGIPGPFCPSDGTG